MKLVKSLLLGSAAGLVAAAGAQAADLPTRKSAPVEYVRICDAYGAGFFYIPGTDTCLKIGGLVLAEERAFTLTYDMGGSYQGATKLSASQLANGTFYPTTGYTTASGYANPRNRDVVGTSALGRVELDARNATAWGTLRAFVRVDSYYGSAATAATGSLSGIGTNNYTANAQIARETTILNKAFIQFAGLTAGRAQSFFDFYADAYGFEAVRNSNTTTALFAYTASFGGGFSGTISFEDQVSRRTGYGTVIGDVGFGPTGGTSQTYAAFTGPTDSVTNGGTRMPDIVGNLRVDQPWGSAQIAAAAHQLRPTFYLSTATGAPGVGSTPSSLAEPIPGYSHNYYGFAAMGGIMFNLPMLAPGDKLWFEGAYAHGAMGYTNGSNFAFFGIVDNTRNYGIGGTGNINNGSGWDRPLDYDCVYTATGQCELTNSYYGLVALKHYWMPTLSSALWFNYWAVRYSPNAISPYSSSFGTATVAGLTNYDEYRIGTNLIWTPIPGFDIGAEGDWLHGVNRNRPYGLGSDSYLLSQGLPVWHANTQTFEGRVRIQRAF